VTSSRNLAEDADLSPYPSETRPASAPSPSQVVIAPTAPANDQGDPDAEAESPAGDAARPLDFEMVEPGNDNAPDPARLQLQKRLSDRVMLAKCLVYLMSRHGFRKDDAEDILQDALLRALCIKTIPADDGRPFYPWMRRFVNNQRFKFLQKYYRRRKRENPVEDMDTFEASAAVVSERAEALARFLEKLELRSESFAKTVAMFRAHESGMSYDEIGAAAGISAEAAKRRVNRLREYIRKNAAQLGAAAALAFAIVLVLLQLEPETGKVTAPDNGPPLNSPLPPLDPEVTAADLRARGFVFCEKGRYEVCVEFLDRAAALDPSQSKDPDVIKWRAEAERALHPK
jgi:RNA polymerase sigma factor (sigma-70 family)